MRISDWSSDVCSSDLRAGGEPVDRADIGALAEPEADDMRRMFFRLGAQPRVMGAVERDDGGAAGFEPFENLALGVCYGVFAAEIFQMRGGYGGDDGGMRTHHAGQLGQFAGMDHPHFEDAVIGAPRPPSPAARHAALVVQTLSGSVRLAG